MQAPSAPGSGDKLDLAGLNGSLLHITVVELVKDIDTSFGVTDAIKATVAVLDGKDKGTVLEDTLVFPKVLRGQLVGAVGAADPCIVGRLGQGVAKPGKSAPWMLNAPTADDLAVATKYEAYAKTQQASQSDPF